MVATLVVAAAACNGGTSDLLDAAAGTWDCDVAFGEDGNLMEVDIGRDGTFAVTAEGQDLVTGTWERDGDQVDVEYEYPLAPAFFGGSTYSYVGVSADTEEITVSEPDKPRSGRFDVEIESLDHVRLHQTEWGNGEAADDEWAMNLDCTKQ